MQGVCKHKFPCIPFDLALLPTIHIATQYFALAHKDGTSCCHSRLDLKNSFTLVFHYCDVRNREPFPGPSVIQQP